MLRKIAGAAAVWLLYSGMAYGASCRLDNYRFRWGIDTSTHLWVSRRTCGSSIHIGSGTIADLKVVTPAKHGRAETVGLARWQYSPTPGYVGQDDFVIEISGDDPRGSRGVSRISVSVDVGK
jgi:hypothetical protein